MPDQAPDFISEVWFQLVIEGIVSAALMIWERISRIATWPEAIVVGLVSFCALVYLGGRFWKPSLRRRIRDWLDTAGYSAKGIQSSNADFALLVTAADGWKLTVSRLKTDNPRHVLIASAVNVPPALQQALAAMPDAERAAALNQAASEMYKYGANFSFTQIAEPGASLLVSDGFAVTDEMSEIDFTTRIRFVVGGAKLLSALLKDVRL